MGYGLGFWKSVRAVLRKLPQEDRERLRERCERLQEEPFPQEVAHVGSIGDTKVFRVRVGSFRILYEVLHDQQLVVIVRIDKRSRVYK